MKRYDAIVLGTGAVGSAALMHLARRGARAVGIDRFEPGHDRGSSHGQTRLIRLAYFEHPDYVPMLRRAFELWRELEAQSGQRLFHQVGLLQVGPPDGEVLPGVRRSAQLHGLQVEDVLPADFAARFPGFRLPETMQAVFERQAGYLLVERCVVAHADEARRLGAELAIGSEAAAWRADGDRLIVETSRESYAAERLIVTAGAWAGQMLRDLRIELRVLRKPLLWFEPCGDAYLPENGCPGFLYETPTGCFYGFPQLDPRGVKVAEHSGGEPVADPLAVDRSLRTSDVQPVAAFLSAWLPGMTARCRDFTVCMYTMTPDGHFVVDRHPRHANVAFAAGLSGHGFKFAPVLGEALCELALDGRTRVPLEFLSLARPALNR